jgi:transposase-like protein
MKPPPDPHCRHSFPAEVISHAVWLYHVFSLSLRDVELLLAERGIIVSYETVRRWCRRFGHQPTRSRPRANVSPSPIASTSAVAASVAQVARRYDVATSLIYKLRQQALSSSCGDTDVVPAVVVDEPRPTSMKATSEDTTAISVELSDGTRMSISMTAPAHLVTVTLRARAVENSEPVGERSAGKFVRGREPFKLSRLSGIRQVS